MIATTNEVRVEHIGKRNVDIGHTEEYVHITWKGDSPTATRHTIHDWLLERVYRDTTQEAGGYFCHRVTVMPHPYRDDEFVGIIHHQLDI